VAVIAKPLCDVHVASEGHHRGDKRAQLPALFQTPLEQRAPNTVRSVCIPASRTTPMSGVPPLANMLISIVFLFGVLPRMHDGQSPSSNAHFKVSNWPPTAAATPTTDHSCSLSPFRAAKKLMSPSSAAAATSSTHVRSHHLG